MLWLIFCGDTKQYRVQLYTKKHNRERHFDRETDESLDDNVDSPDPWSPPPGPIQIDSEVEVHTCVCMQYSTYF